MGRISGKDLRGILDFLATARLGTAGDPIPRPTLIALRDLVGADDADYVEFRVADGKAVAYAETESCPPAPGTEAAMLAYGGQNPLGWRKWGPADGAVRLSDRVPPRALRRLEFHGEFLAPNHLTDLVKVWLWRSPDSVACVQLWRHGGTFSRRDQDVVAVLQQDLVRLRDQAMTDGARPGTLDAGLTAREAEVLIWAIRGHSHAQIADRLGSTAGTVGKHLEHAYEKLDVTSRAQAVDRILLSGPLD